VYEINDMVDKIYLYDDIYGAGLWRALRENYDLIVDTEQYHRLSSLIAYATGAANRCGFDNYGKGLFYSHRVKYSDTDYEISSFLSLATCVTGREYNFNAKNPFLFVDVKWQQQADNILYKIEGFPFIVVVPGTQSPTRIWPAERYVDVIQWLLDHDFAVCILGGRDTITAGSFIADKMKHGKVLNLTGKTNIPQTSAILQKARLYLGTDCGVLHIAVGVGTSTVHMFGSGIQGKWAPMGQNYYLVDKKLPCSPCTQYGYTPPCPYNVACMRAISSNDVIQVLEKKFYK
jgi:ADP-heptose:LPS heptosyltransferase